MHDGLQATEEASKGEKCPCNPGQSRRGILRMPEGPDFAKHHLVYPQLFLCNQRQFVQEFSSCASVLICKSMETILVKVNTALNNL